MLEHNLTLECIKDYQSFLGIEEEWDQFLKKTEVSSPFLTYGWQKAWLETYGKQNKILVLVIKYDEEIVGICPLIEVKRMGFKMVELVGTGKSDWLDIPVVPLHRKRVLKKIMQFLVQEIDNWHLINFRDILADSPSILCLEEVCKELKICARRKKRTVSPYLQINMDWNKFLQSKSAHFRTKLKYHKKKAQKAGKELKIEKISQMDKDYSILNTMEDVESKSWKVSSGNPKITTRIGKEFYKRICEYLSRKGYLDIWIATLDGQAIAFLLNIVYQGKCYHYNGTFDQRFTNISPGLILHSEAIESAFDTGLTEYDFLSGDEPYKYKWCRDRRDIYQMVFFRKKLISFMAFMALVKTRWILKEYDFFVKINQKFAPWRRRFLSR